jgi:hypothetical protein
MARKRTFRKLNSKALYICLAGYALSQMRTLDTIAERLLVNKATLARWLYGKGTISEMKAALLCQSLEELGLLKEGTLQFPLEPQEIKVKQHGLIGRPFTIPDSCEDRRLFIDNNEGESA